MPKNGKLNQLNGAFHVSTTNLQFVVESAAESELRALYHNCQTGIIFHLTLTNMGHLQPKHPVHWDNATAVGIVNSSIKHQKSQSMEMTFFWVAGAVEAGKFDIQY
jgi:hypothetical protein